MLKRISLRAKAMQSRDPNLLFTIKDLDYLSEIDAVVAGYHEKYRWRQCMKANRPR